ncbi:MAG TPA: glucose-1-phosphate adenylyltransferase, partial [Acetobacteraceae bacterium]|nr:glucose-1-phosphate adenylyltransferase [Acetobacteraceae bacterium]
DRPVWTDAEITPPAKFIHDEDARRGSATSSMVSGGCTISGTRIDKSLLFTGVRTHSYGVLTHVVALRYVTVGRSVRLTKGVIDHGAKIPDGLERGGTLSAVAAVTGDG